MNKITLAQFALLISVIVGTCYQAEAKFSPPSQFDGPPPGANGPPPMNREKTEAAFCETCESSKNPQGDKIKVAAADIISKISSETDKEEDKKHAERVRDRMIRQINNQDCPSLSDNEDDGNDFADREGPPSMGGDRGVNMPDGDDAKALFKYKEFQDDVADARLAHEEKCEKKMKRSRQKAMLSQSSMQGNGGMQSMMSSNNMGGMGGMSNMMGGMSGMGGMTGFGGGANSIMFSQNSLLGQNSMFPFSSMMNNYPFSNGFMGNSMMPQYNLGMGTNLGQYSSYMPFSGYNSLVSSR